MSERIVEVKFPACKGELVVSCLEDYTHFMDKGTGELSFRLDGSDNEVFDVLMELRELGVVTYYGLRGD